MNSTSDEHQNHENQDQDDHREVLQEILAGRKFSLAELIGREGGSFMKGESPVPKLLQVKTEINFLIDQNLTDSSGALKAVLQTLIAADEIFVSRHLDSPLNALKEFLEMITQSSELFYELVRQVDFKWGQIYRERPYFQQPGQAPHPDDEYTHESVHRQLINLLNALVTDPQDESKDESI